MNDVEAAGNLPLITNRHYNDAITLLGNVYRCPTNPTEQYPEIGAVECQNAMEVVASLLSQVEHYKKIT